MSRLKENTVYYFKYDESICKIIERKIVNKPYDWIRFNKTNGWVTNNFNYYIECWYVSSGINTDNEYKNKINNLILIDINYLNKIRRNKFKRIL